MGNPQAEEPAKGDTDSTSLSLLERVKAQDGNAWQRLVDLYSPLIFYWCRRAGLNTEDAGDLLQEVFAAVAANIAQFHRERPGDTFRGWLRVITRNRIRLHFRKEANRPQAAGGSSAQIRIQELPDKQSDESAASSTEDPNELSDLLHWGLELVHRVVEERTWRAFWLCTVEQHSSTEVGQQLQMTPGAVRQAKHKVLRRLRRELGEPPGEPTLGGANH